MLLEDDETRRHGLLASANEKGSWGRLPKSPCHVRVVSCYSVLLDGPFPAGFVLDLSPLPRRFGWRSHAYTSDATQPTRVIPQRGGSGVGICRLRPDCESLDRPNPVILHTSRRRIYISHPGRVCLLLVHGESQLHHDAVSESRRPSSSAGALVGDLQSLGDMTDPQRTLVAFSHTILQ